MRIALRGLEFRLFIGDLPWERRHLQKIRLDLVVLVRGKPPDYWALSKALVKKFSGSRHEWLEDLAAALRSYLKKEWKLHGTVTLSKFPRLPGSPKIFQVEVPL